MFHRKCESCSSMQEDMSSFGSTGEGKTDRVLLRCCRQLPLGQPKDKEDSPHKRRTPTPPCRKAGTHATLSPPCPRTEDKAWVMTSRETVQVANHPAQVHTFEDNYVQSTGPCQEGIRGEPCGHQQSEHDARTEYLIRSKYGCSSLDACRDTAPPVPPLTPKRW